VNDHVASAPPVTTVGAALRDELLAAEAQSAVAAAPGLDVDLGAVVKHVSAAYSAGD
jgi:hypothetical protein